ncbi:hypothetical protein OHB14_38560 [Streptomyces sp. NBC_01613]|uniref:hypothetical protein n=1 Tax=Streptomyces sp. NBC_01613 TaxID=2975896 RepID=UPI003870BB53
MTQPPGWPPQGGYGPQQPPQQPPYPGPYSPPPAAQPPGQIPNPYATQQPYGYGGYQPAPEQGSGGSNKGKVAALVVGAVAAVVFIGGGIYLATNGGGDDGGKPAADRSVSASPSASSSAQDTDDSTTEPSDPATDDGSDYGDTGDDTNGTAPATGFQGQWQDDDNKTLTIGAKYTTGDYTGKYPMSYIDPGGDGILTGMGMDRSDGSFRMALSPMSTTSTSGDDYKAATLTRSGDSVVITWDDGGSDTLAYVGE